MYKCAYSKCLHGDDKLIPVGEEVAIGKARYFHKDCAQTKNDIKEIIDLWKNQINSNVVYAELQRVINTIIFVRHNSSSLLLFGLKYYISKGIPLNYPQGLYYVIQNKDVYTAYQKKKVAEAVKISRISVDNTETTFQYKPNENKSFDKLFGEG